jgi:DNA polymerase I-like protein with 3'-5' exonuclease and polymerase domains/uracil-DNA glycosylase
VGNSGGELDLTLGHAGVQRAQVALLNVLACRPPGNELSQLLNRWRRENREREKRGEPLLPSPMDNCRPRLLRELQGFTDVIALGGTAVRALMQSNVGAMAVRGGMIDGWLDDPNGLGDRFYRAEGPFAARGPSEEARRLRILPTLHPAFVLRARRWTRVFREDVGRAVRWFDGRLGWTPPEITIRPTPAQLRAFLAGLEVGAYDVETDDIEPLTARLRCIGVGDGMRVLLVPFLGIDGKTRFYTDAEERDCKDAFRAWFTSDRHVKVGHNCGYYDRIVIEQHLGVTPEPLIDTILLHRLVESELPHNLGFVASLYAELAPAWKADRTATTAETDRDLHEYCSLDVAQSYRILPRLREHVELRDQAKVYKFDAHRQAMCAEMHRVGMYVDQARRRWHEYRWGVESWEWRQRILTIAEQAGVAGKDGRFNPQSVPQVRELLFERWHLPVPEQVVRNRRGEEVLKPMLTKGGDPSTGDDAIRALLLRPEVGKVQRAFLLALRRQRAADKLLGTYIAKLRPSNEDADVGVDLEDAAELGGGDAAGGWAEQGIDEYEAAEHARRERKGQRQRKPGVVDPRTGRMHPDYNCHAANTGRLSSSRPNATNFPSILRDMVVAEEGHVFVGADQEQLELRMAAGIWQITAYLRALELGADPHATTAHLAFGDAFLDAPGWPPGKRIFEGGRVYFLPDPGAKWKGLAKMQRDLAKRVQYAGQYRASVETIWRVITSSEDEAGRLIYADLTLPEVRERYNRWLGGVPELPAGWDAEVAFWTKHRYLVEPVLGRRRDFLDGENPQELSNFRCQSGGTGVMCLAEMAIRARVPCQYAGRGTGITNQCHDSLKLEVPARDAERVAAALTDAMCMTIPTIPGVRFVGKAEIGRDWKSAC